MSDIYTTIQMPAFHPAIGYCCNGRKTRQEAIAEAKQHYQHELARIAVFLALPEDEFDVRVVRGYHVQHLVEELKP